jgi:hypothetical protein
MRTKLSLRDRLFDEYSDFFKSEIFLLKNIFNALRYQVKSLSVEVLMLSESLTMT